MRHTSARPVTLGALAGLVVLIGLTVGCTTQTRVSNEPAPAAESSPSAAQADADAAHEHDEEEIVIAQRTGQPRTNPFSRAEVDKLEGSLDPLQSVPTRESEGTSRRWFPR
jgi:hypothetical protein